MKLKTYFGRPDALTVSQLREAVGVPSDVQVRQWIHGYGDRVPNPENCVAIEKATGSLVMRWDLRPHDWHLIWPELIVFPGAPKPPKVVKRPKRTKPTKKHESLAPA